MQPQTWAFIVLAIVVVGLAVWLWSRQRRTTTLRRRFGPEYEREVTEVGNTAKAEDMLSDRVARREKLHVVPLPEPVRLGYVHEWRTLQERFVDQPSETVERAHRLLDEVMRHRGYPTSDIDERAELVSVDHPNVVQEYRAARVIRDRNVDGGVTTEELRQALVHYRALFSDLLAPDDRTDRDSMTAEHS